MKYTFKIACLALLLSFNFGFSQFNTLKPTMPKKDEKINTEVAEEKDSKKEVKSKDKTAWSKIFNGTTKTQLKNEIDSLKTIMKTISSNSSKNLISLKQRDSILMVTQTELLSKSFSQLQELQASINEVQSNQSKSNDSYPILPPVMQVSMPLNSKLRVTSPYGTRVHPIFGITKTHNGVDLAANYEPIYSVLGGIISASGWDSKGGGNFIKIRHYNRFETTYMHLSNIYYRTGDYVDAGAVIGRSGNTGNSTGPHLHFSVREYGKLIEPTKFLKDLINLNTILKQNGQNQFTNR